VRWQAWPPLLAALAWAFLLASLVVTYSPATPLEGLALVVVAGVPLALCLRTLVIDWRSAEWHGWFPQTAAHVPAGWGQRLILGAGLALLVGAVVFDLLTRPSSFDIQWFDGNLPLTVTHLRPGTGDVWAYLVALGLTLGLFARRAHSLARPLLASAVSLGAAALVGGVLLVAAGGGRVDAAGISGDPTSCQHPDIGVGVPLHFGGVAVSGAYGDVDGQALGTANIRSDPGGVDEGVSAAFDSVWGKRSVNFDGSGTPLRYRDEFGLAALSLWVFHSDETIVADDLGIDLVGRAPLRHCRLVIDGRGAVNGFEALRWLMGAHFNAGARLSTRPTETSDPGTGLEVWRGTVDYWIEPAAGPSGAVVGYRGVGLASVTVDGQPRPDWPITGLRATLHAWIWFPPPAP
jgi:hypothetical protein